MLGGEYEKCYINNNLKKPMIYIILVQTSQQKWKLGKSAPLEKNENATLLIITHWFQHSL